MGRPETPRRGYQATYLESIQSSLGQPPFREALPRAVKTSLRQLGPRDANTGGQIHTPATVTEQMPSRSSGFQRGDGQTQILALSCRKTLSIYQQISKAGARTPECHGIYFRIFCGLCFWSYESLFFVPIAVTVFRSFSGFPRL